MRLTLMQLVRACTLLAILCFAVSAKSSSPKATDKVSTVERSYQHAAAMAELVEQLQSKIIPAKLKTSLLENVRPEDKDYAKSIIVRWKPYSPTRIVAEFDQLVVRDDRGNETVRMKVLNSTERTFSINGRTWTMPSAGSITKSLRQHLYKKNSTANRSHHDLKASIFASILSPDSAFAAADEAKNLVPIYAYFSKAFGLLPNPSEALKYGDSPEPYLARDHGAINNFLETVQRKPTTVQCHGSSAFGRANIDGIDADFESRPNGSIVLTLRDQNKTKLLVTSAIRDHRTGAKKQLARLDAFEKSKGTDQEIARDILQSLDTYQDSYLLWEVRLSARLVDGLRVTNRETVEVAAMAKELRKFYEHRTELSLAEELTITACESPECINGSGEPNSSIFRWHQRPPGKAVKRATNWSAQETDKRSLISIDENRTRASLHLSPKASALDIKTGSSLAWAANAELAAQQRASETPLRTLRPLGACCADEPCRKSLLERSIELKSVAPPTPTKQ